MSMDHYPTDWLELKHMLTEVMQRIHLEHGLTGSLVTLERHMPSMEKAFIGRLGVYSKGLIPFNRRYEAVFRLKFNPNTREVTVIQASFNYTLAGVRDDFWWMERGVRYKTPPLIPKEHLNLNDPRTFLMEPSTIRYPSYGRNPKLLYGGNTVMIYQPRRRGIYSRPERRLYE